MNRVYPLSLLAFTATARALSLPRHPIPSPFSRSASSHHRDDARRQTGSVELHVPASMNSTGNHKRCGKGGCFSQVAGMDHRYRRHVKPKKQHEIKCLAEVGTKDKKKKKKLRGLFHLWSLIASCPFCTGHF